MTVLTADQVESRRISSLRERLAALRTIAGRIGYGSNGYGPPQVFLLSFKWEDGREGRVALYPDEVDRLIGLLGKDAA